MKNERELGSFDTITYNTFYQINKILRNQAYLLKIGFHFIQKIKDELCKNVVCPFCVAKGVMDTG